VYASKVFLELMMKREQKSAIVFVSSIAGRMVLPGWASYSATKCFVTNLGKCLYYEVKDKVDMMVWTPGLIKTDFAANFSGKEGIQEKFMKGGISVQRAVSAMLKDVGHTACSDGAVEHATTNCMVASMMSVSCYGKRMQRDHDKFLEEEQPGK